MKKHEIFFSKSDDVSENECTGKAYKSYKSFFAKRVSRYRSLGFIYEVIF